MWWDLDMRLYLTKIQIQLAVVVILSMYHIKTTEQFFLFNNCKILNFESNRNFTLILKSMYLKIKYISLQQNIYWKYPETINLLLQILVEFNNLNYQVLISRQLNSTNNFISSKLFFILDYFLSFFFHLMREVLFIVS